MCALGVAGAVPLATRDMASRDCVDGGLWRDQCPRGTQEVEGFCVQNEPEAALPVTAAPRSMPDKSAPTQAAPDATEPKQTMLDAGMAGEGPTAGSSSDAGAPSAIARAPAPFPAVEFGAGDGAGIAFLRIPARTFTMGDATPGRSDETPPT